MGGYQHGDLADVQATRARKPTELIGGQTLDRCGEHSWDDRLRRDGVVLVAVLMAEATNGTPLLQHAGQPKPQPVHRRPGYVRSGGANVRPE